MPKTKKLSLKHKKAISKALIRYHSKCKICLNRRKSNNRKEYMKRRVNEIRKNQERRKSKKK